MIAVAAVLVVALLLGRRSRTRPVTPPTASSGADKSPFARWWAARRSPGRRDAQLAGVAAATATGLRAGMGLEVALRAAGDAAGPPLRDELGDHLRTAASGERLGLAIRSWRDADGASDDVRLLATALLLGAEAGGSLARALDRAAATLRERQALRGEARALATQARTSAVVLGLAPIAFAILVSTIDPRTAGVLLGSPIGWGCIVVGVTLESLGALWMRRITRSVW